MPVHNWTTVTPGTFHDFHAAWIAEIRRALNNGILPDGYYAMAEQVSGNIGPEVLTLQDLTRNGEDESLHESVGGTASAIAVTQPRVSVIDTLAEAMVLAARRRRRLVIRHATGDRVVALIEIVSPGNKQGRGALESFADKAIAAIEAGYHLLIMDLFPPGSLDPAGMHGVIWGRMGGSFDAPADKPLTLAAYRAAGTVTCFVEPISVGTPLPDMPLFVDADHYVNVPLELTYQRAWEGEPRRWRKVIEKA